MPKDDYLIVNLKDILEKHPLPEINKQRNSNDDFVADLIDVSNTIKQVLVLAASIIPNRAIEKLQQGILIGHMVRVAKLYDCFQLLICQHRFEISLLIARSLTETSIVLKYLLMNIDTEICNKFIKASLAYDKKLLLQVYENTKERTPLPFEKRIIYSIKNTFQKAGFDIEALDFKKDKKWHKDLFSLAKVTGVINYYEYLYRIFSRAEHGSWYYLERYCLEDKTTHYKPELKYTVVVQT